MLLSPGSLAAHKGLDELSGRAGGIGRSKVLRVLALGYLAGDLEYLVTSHLP